MPDQHDGLPDVATIDRALVVLLCLATAAVVLLDKYYLHH